MGIQTEFSQTVNNMQLKSIVFCIYNFAKKQLLRFHQFQQLILSLWKAFN